MALDSGSPPAIPDRGRLCRNDGVLAIMRIAAAFSPYPLSSNFWSFNIDSLVSEFFENAVLVYYGLKNHSRNLLLIHAMHS